MNKIERGEDKFSEVVIESASERIIRENKVSAFSRANEIKAVVPDFEKSSEAELEALGLQKEGDRWYVPNRKDFSDPLDESSVLIDWGFKKETGERDLGFCSKEEFEKIYVYSEKYKKNEIEYIDATKLEKNKVFSATKCATASFTILPIGTKIKSNEGEVTSEKGRILMINEAKDSLYLIDIGDFLAKHIADPLNPVSKKTFELLGNYQGSNKDAKDFNDLFSEFKKIDREEELYRELLNEDISIEIEGYTLYEKFKVAKEIVKQLDKEISMKINSISFENRLLQAKEILKETMKDPSLSEKQKKIKYSYILTRLLPKTNNHQHLKGSVPMDIIESCAEKNGFSEEEIEDIKLEYEKGVNGFASLHEFSYAYAKITRAIQTREDYQNAVKGIIEEATKAGQLTVEIRSSVIGQKDFSNPADATENILQAMESSAEEIGEEAPKLGFVFLGYRGRDGKPEQVLEHAELAVKFARKYPSKKFGFDIAGPEDTGYSPEFFKKAFDLIKSYNETSVGEKIGITIHAGETLTYNEGKPGFGAIEEALKMKPDRIGHGLRALDMERILTELQGSNTVIEICGLSNILAIPENTEGKKIHPVQEFLNRDIPITLCTDNDSMCSSNITKEYALFQLTGHSNLMNWNKVKEIARNGIASSFITAPDREVALKIFNERIRKIEKMYIGAKKESEESTKQSEFKLRKIKKEQEEAQSLQKLKQELGAIKDKAS